MHWYGLPTFNDDTHKRLDSLAKKVFPRLPYNELVKLIGKKLIRVNSKPSRQDQRIQDRDIIVFAGFLKEWLSPSLLTHLHDGKTLPSQVLTEFNQNNSHTSALPSLTPASRSLPFPPSRIVYSDEDILVLSKVAGQKIFGSSSSQSISRTLRSQAKKSLSFVPSPCHRLDTATSGILICALSAQGARWFANLQTQGAIHKIYLGLLEQPLVDGWTSHHLYRDGVKKITLALDKALDKKIEYSQESRQSPRSLEYLGHTNLYIKHLGSLHTNSATATKSFLYLLILSGEGGKSHQIRAQCAALGSPLLGDTKYGGQPLKLAHSFKSSSPYYSSFYLHASCYCLKSHDTKHRELRSLRAPIPQPWYTLVSTQNQTYLRELERNLDLLAQEWDETISLDTNTDIIALCTSTLGGVMG